MTKAKLRSLDLRAEVFKALANPTRILLLETLRDGPRCVCELAAEIGVEKSAASKHLSQLKAAGLVDDEHEGASVRYRLIAPCVLDMAACAERSIVENRKMRLRGV